MQNDTDAVHVGGNFVVASGNSSTLTAGTLYIGGNFRQVSGYDGSFYAYGTHKVVFNGSGTQSIQFDSYYSGFNVVRFENPNIELKGNYLRGFTLEDDLNLTLSTNTLNLNGTMNLNCHDLGSNTFDGNFTLKGGNMNINGVSLTVNGNLISSCNIDLNGYDLTVNGDLTSEANIDLNGGYLTVTGTLYQENGTMHI